MPISVLRTGGGVEVDDRVDAVFGALSPVMFGVDIRFVWGISMHHTRTKRKREEH